MSCYKDQDAVVFYSGGGARVGMETSGINGGKGREAAIYAQSINDNDRNDSNNSGDKLIR